MITKEKRNEILALINQEVVPAIGCTEPMAVALCTARATELLGCRPEKITAQLSGNILKNAMGVGIPGTGMIGLPIAIALGALIGKSAYQLEVLKDLTPEALEEGKQFIAENRINIGLKPNICELLYIEITCEAGGKSKTAIIEGSHTHFREISPDETAENAKNGATDGKCHCEEEEEGTLNLRTVYDFAMETPVEELRFILKTQELNMQAAREALKHNYGHNLGKTIDRPLGKGIFGNSIFSHIISKTAAACDARMGGAMIPVMSNSGSGNQGICATNPVAVYAQENENTEEELIRALTLSHLTAIYIKQSLGRLSALCGCVVAGIGSSVGITYLMGGNYEHVCRSVKNMIANLTGMLCDGAKPSCSLKIASGVSTAVLSAVLSMEGKCVSSAEGIVDDCVDKTIHNLTSIGAEAMCQTDHMVLEIMTHKNGE
ncbi:MAG: L-serine ammonia-lyase, iron-sulfur-dependent, subunit alpha [Prevotella sp.]|nr:L-serine ammonia-lyase, iron-sulfur-dependent, subunit alpha [Prevotella sp.]